MRELSRGFCSQLFLKLFECMCPFDIIRKPISKSSAPKETKMEEKLCGIYGRISDPKEANIKGNSVETQISRSKEFIKYKNSDPDKKFKWVLVDEYADEGKSGKDTKRENLQRLLADIRKGRINTVICVKLDRITRSLLDYYNNLNVVFQKYGVDFISLSENFDTSTPMGKAMLSMTLVWAELEREQTSQRTIVKLHWRAEQGLWNGNHVLGYDLIDKRLVINKTEAKYVNLIFEKYLAVGSVLKVVEFLDAHGYRTKEYISNKKKEKHGGSRLYNQYIAHALKNPVYIGQIKYRGKIFPGVHEPIVDKKVWHEANAKLNLQSPKRTNPKRETKHTYLLQGLLKCGKCGSYMSTKFSTGRNGPCFYYQCTQNARRGKTGCDMKYVPAIQLEKVVLGKLKEISTDKATIQIIVNAANKDNSGTLNGLKKDRKTQEIKLTGINNKIKNLIHNIANNQTLKNSDTIAEELGRLEEQKTQIEKDIQNIQFETDKVQQQVISAVAVYQALKKFSELCDIGNPQELKDLITSFVERITWKGSEIEIALFEHEAEKGLFPLDGNQSGDGALDVRKKLPREGSNLGHCG